MRISLEWYLVDFCLILGVFLIFFAVVGESWKQFLCKTTDSKGPWVRFVVHVGILLSDPFPQRFRL